MKYSIRHQSILSCVLLSVIFSASVEAVPQIQSWPSSNGGKVLFIETHALPMVDIKLVFAGGSARDGSLPGVALFTNSLLISGAGQWNADEIAERLDSIGAQLNTDSARDMALVNLRSLRENSKFVSALEILQSVVAEPQFNPKDIERDRRRLLTMLQHKQQQPESIAEDAFMQLMYGTHPYAQPPEGTLESVKRLSRNDLLAFHKRYYVARNAVLALVGDLTREEAESIAERILGALREGEKAPELPAVEVPQQPRQRRIDMPITQTHVLIGQPVMARGDRDFFPLYVGNHVLGGSGFGSRLMDEIREQRGLAYDTYSYFLPMSAAGPFEASVKTRNEQVAEAEQLLEEIIARFVETGPTAEEVDKAIKNITGSFPLNIDSNADLVGYLGMIGFYDYPLDYLQTFVDRVRSVTSEQIHDAFQRRLNPKHFVKVVVGGSAEE